MSFARSDLVLEGSSYNIWIYGYDKYSMASKICPFPIWDVLMALQKKNKLNWTQLQSKSYIAQIILKCVRLLNFPVYLLKILHTLFLPILEILCPWHHCLVIDSLTIDHLIIERNSTTTTTTEYIAVRITIAKVFMSFWDTSRWWRKTQQDSPHSIIEDWTSSIWWTKTSVITISVLIYY